MTSFQALITIGCFLGAAYAVMRAENNRYLAARSKSWPSVQGFVLSSQVVAEKDEGTMYYRPQILYRYKISGHKFESEQVCFGGINRTADSIESEIYVERFRAGEAVQVFYDPERPSVSVLERAVASGNRTYYVFAFLLAVTAGVFLFA